MLLLLLTTRPKTHEIFRKVFESANDIVQHDQLVVESDCNMRELYHHILCGSLNFFLRKYAFIRITINGISIRTNNKDKCISCVY